MSYTVDSLKAFNDSVYGGYAKRLEVDEGILLKVNNLVRIIEEGLDEKVPQAGDIMLYTDEEGIFYGEAHIEEAEKVDSEEYKLTICCDVALYPFIDGFVEGKSFETQAVGNKTKHIPHKAEYIGRAVKRFRLSISRYISLNNALVFEANVNVWRYTEGKHEFTTEFFDKYSVIKRKDKCDNPYYVIRGIHGNSRNNRVLHSDKDYNGWLKTFHGVETDLSENSITVWTYKQETNLVNLETYNSISDAVIDSALWNGAIQECKRLYKDKTVITYMPYQDCRIALPHKEEFMNADEFGKESV